MVMIGIFRAPAGIEIDNCSALSILPFAGQMIGAVLVELGTGAVEAEQHVLADA
jgi:hypothetical protein